MTNSQLDRIETELAAETDGDRLVGDSKWYIAGLPQHLEPQAGFVEDERALTGGQLSRIRKEIASESEGDRLVGDSKWYIAGLPSHQEPQAGFVENPAAVAR
jgi:hypothetical protein